MSRPPRIVQVIPSLQVGGLQKVVARLVTHLGESAQHFVLTPAGDGPLRAAFPASVAIMALGDLPGSRKLNALRMARIFRAFKPDIVHSRNWTCIDAIIGARLAGVPVIIHGEHGREAADPEGRSALRRKVRRALSPLVTRFVTVSRDLARWLVSEVGVPSRKVTQIYNGVDTAAFCPEGREAARQALGLPADIVAIGTVGRLDPVKDHRGLLEAFRRVAADDRAMLLIVGDGPCRADLDRQRRTLGLEQRVHLLGERPDVPVILRALDVFTLPSVGEGISNSILEAMATGLPVVATKVGGNPELVEPDVTGMLVAPQSPDALAAALQRYLADPMLVRKHGEAARQRVVREFGLERMLAAYETLYADLFPETAR
jgi:sugar transferase (PEP-CTERM/EpsH1 system associated)